MRLEFVGSTSNVNGCPTIFRTERGTLVIQGRTVTDEEALTEMRRHGNGIPSHEPAVEVPAELLRFLEVDQLPEVVLDERRAAFVVDNPAVPLPSR